MNLNELKFLQNFYEVMHISVRHDIFYNFSSGVKNVENKEKKPFFVGHFHKFLRLHPLTPFDSRPKFCAK